jgi:tetratricopeptide (TPR) repeat protein
MTQYDKLWDYYKPAETEVKFREALKETSLEKDRSEHLQLLTQLARTQGLQRKFDEAHKILDEVEKELSETPAVEHIRYNLERGRTYNSSGSPEKSQSYFANAFDIAKGLKEDGYAVDAIHMLAIIAPPEAAIALNEQAVLYAENSEDPKAKNWLGSLYNNLGWGYFDTGSHEKALSIFLRALKFFEDKKSTYQTFIAKWTVARALRELKRIDDALTIQLGLFEESVNTGQNDGYVHEELGELFLIKNDKQKSAFHFEKAYELLSVEPYVHNMSKQRLERIKELTK